MLCENLSLGKNGHLYFAGQDTTVLAAQYGTPVYLLDEDYIRSQCRLYRSAFRKHFGPGSCPLYASKANACKRLYEIMREEDMGIDVVSSGEIYCAAQAGYDLSRAYFHGNNKTDEDIAFGMERHVGYFVADNAEEIMAIEAEAARRGIRQKVLLRLTPGIDPHTYEEVSTGKVDSKFGSAIETGQAEEITLRTLAQPHVELVGFHCHVGSQVFGEDVFERAAAVMLEFIAAMREKHGYMARQLDLGGGYGVRYVEEDPRLDVDVKVGQVAAAIHRICARLHIEMPEIHMEPGRSIVAAAGMTLYTCGAVKKIPGYKNCVSVDGGMTDNPRFALYKSRYTCLPANKMDQPRTMEASLVGRCCESGDIIQEHVLWPASMERGDIVAVCTTGAYNYSMASHYNKIPRPPIVMLRDGGSYVAVRRETVADLCACDQ